MSYSNGSGHIVIDHESCFVSRGVARLALTIALTPIPLSEAKVISIFYVMYIYRRAVTCQ